MSDAFEREINAETVDRAAANLDHAIDDLREIKGVTRVIKALERLRATLDAKAERIRQPRTMRSGLGAKGGAE